MEISVVREITDMLVSVTKFNRDILGRVELTDMDSMSSDASLFECDLPR